MRTSIRTGDYLRSGDCGAKFKNVCNLKAILDIKSAMHPNGFQFAIENPDMNSVRIT